MGLHLFFSALFGDGNMGSIGKHEISHSAKTPFEMTAINNNEGEGKVAAAPQLFPLPFINSDVSFRTK